MPVDRLFLFCYTMKKNDCEDDEKCLININ